MDYNWEKFNSENPTIGLFIADARRLAELAGSDLNHGGKLKQLIEITLPGVTVSEKSFNQGLIKNYGTLSALAKSMQGLATNLHSIENQTAQRENRPTNKKLVDTLYEIKEAMRNYATEFSHIVSGPDQGLGKQFFNRPTLKVARELLGKFLIHKMGRKEAVGMITEVEAYVGPEDKASHASRGRTERNKIMFGKAGYWYVYLIYGMYYCLNIVTERENYPAAVLIRSVTKLLSPIGEENLVGDNFVIRGPGRLTKYFKIDKSFNGKLANYKTGLWIEDRGIKINPRLVKRGKRIGVDYAGRWKDKLWRFYL